MWDGTLSQWAINKTWPVTDKTITIEKAASFVEGSDVPKQVVSIGGDRDLADGGISVRLLFNALEESYKMSKIVIYAKADDEEKVLIEYTNETPQEIPSESENKDFLFQIWCSFKLDSAYTVNVNVAQETVITIDTLKDFVEDIAGLELTDVELKGDSTSVTPEGDDSSTKIATTEFVSDNYMKIGRDYVTAGKKDGTILGQNATAEGNDTEASGESSHAEGEKTTADGHFSHTEGYFSRASGQTSHAEGDLTFAKGHHSHVEGSGGGSYSYTLRPAAIGATTYKIYPTNHNIKKGEVIHRSYNNLFARVIESNPSDVLSENTITVDSSLNPDEEIPSGGTASLFALSRASAALGNSSHAEGINTVSIGEASHSEGLGTIASGINQHVSGKYNIEDNTNTYAEIIGNGTIDTRSNARTLDWNGNEWLAGTLKIGGTSYEDAKEVSTKEYVDDSIDNIELTDVTLENPELTGIPMAPTAEAGTNTNQVATTAFVNTAITNALANIANILEIEAVYNETTCDISYRLKVVE